MSLHQHQAVRKLKSMAGRRGARAVRKPVARKCTACKMTHVPPTGRGCTAPRSPASELDESEVTDHTVAGEEVRQTDRLTPNGAGGLPVTSSPVATGGNRPRRSVEENLDMMAEAMSRLSGQVTELQQQMVDVQQERVNSSWANVEALAGKNNFDFTGSQPRVQPAQPVIQDVPLSLEAIRSHPTAMRRAADRQSELQNILSNDIQGDSKSVSVKSGRDRVGGAEHKLIYVRWPQEAIFIGPERRRVRYDDLDQTQWVAGLTAIAAQERDPLVQKNMLTYLAALFQDASDYSFRSAHGAHALILSMLEESRLTWDDLPGIQKVREDFSYRSHVSSDSNIASHAPAFKGKSNPAVRPNTSRITSRRICKNYNSGSCVHGTSHVSNGFSYDHHCSFCATKGSRSNHPELSCRNKGQSESGRVNNPS